MNHPFYSFDYHTRQRAVTDLTRLVRWAKDLVEENPFPRDGIYIGHSGGKDSVAVTWIATQVLGTSVPIIHSAKPAGENAVHPKAKELIYSIAEHRPVLLYPRDIVPPKEYATQIDGTKACEFDRTDGRHTDVIIDGKAESRKDLKPYVKNGLFGKNFIFPLYDWEDCHVWALIYYEKLPFSGESLEQA
jgi:hypothetical protein